MTEKKENVKLEERSEVIEVDMSEEETKDQILQHEGSLLDCLLAAADYVDCETDTIEIIRRGVKYFEIEIQPLSEDDFMTLRKRYTKLKKNRKNGLKVEDEFEVAKYRCSVIYNASTEKTKAEIWDNRNLQDALRKKGHIVTTALDVVEGILLPGEKDLICDAIDKLCGYSEENLIETSKNS